ncbi:ParB/RepB/Spo0J family partition protein [Streptomyces sp. NPDC102437]|uniref:ParB/RepB/Spo0J family partition protein n=1 Tax=Streptomyces sp. NPDC102437 TaxID=3366175 RepID=UPI0037FDC089
MSKADQLGAGRFGAAPAVSARRQAVAAATGAATVGAPDSRLRTICLEQLVPTRFNPRQNFGTPEDLLEFGLKLKKKQLQPAVAVTREAYLKLWADEAALVGTARYVIANGERRYRASEAAGLGTLEVVVDDEVAKSKADFLDAVLSENNDREDLDPIERALGIQTMVEELGGKAKVAEHYGKSGGWVTQQMYLLSLAPDLQKLVSSGDLPVRETRALVKLSHAEQRAAWQQRMLERDVEKERPRTRRTAEAPAPPVSSGPSGFTAVKPTRGLATEPVSSPAAPRSELPASVPMYTAADAQPSPTAPSPAVDDPVQVPDEPSQSLPEPRTQLSTVPTGTIPVVPAKPPIAERPQVKMPWHDGRAAMDIIFRKLSGEERRNALGRYFELVGGAEAAAADLKVAASPQFRELLADHLMDSA